MNIIGNRKFSYALSGAMVLASLVAVILWQFRYGIDFVGGTLWEISAPGFGQHEVAETLRAFGIENASMTPSGDGRELTIRFREIDEKTHQEILRALKERTEGLEELRFETVGPTIGKTLRQKAITSVVGVLVVIALYIAWAFRQVSRPISSWKYGIVTLVTLFHDVMAPVGVFAFLGRFAGVEIDSQFIVALLVVMGFSVHDTIVVFDRIRENLRKAQKGERFEETVNRSVNETFVRSVNTSLTVLLVLGGLYFWGPDTLRHFVLALLVGIGVGTYSSIFLASPLLVDWASRSRG
jgi:preprotein translocase subunit SecF